MCDHTFIASKWLTYQGGTTAAAFTCQKCLATFKGEDELKDEKPKTNTKTTRRAKEQVTKN